jgi:hypothetical protein
MREFWCITTRTFLEALLKRKEGKACFWGREAQAEQIIRDFLNRADPEFFDDFLGRLAKLLVSDQVSSLPTD